MGRLTSAELRTRLSLDYRAMRSLRGAALGRVQPFVSPVDRERGREATPDEARRGLVTVYRVEFCFPMLRAATAPLARAHALFQIPAQGYPFEGPSVSFEPGAVPFSPHVHATGLVCLGEAWTLAGGHWLLPHLVVHVMKLVNFDEPCTRDGFSVEAIHHARVVLRGRPLNPGLDYPVFDDRMPPEEAPVPHDPAPLFRRSIARPLPPTPSARSEDLGFRRRSA